MQKLSQLYGDERIQTVNQLYIDTLRKRLNQYIAVTKLLQPDNQYIIDLIINATYYEIDQIPFNLHPNQEESLTYLDVMDDDVENTPQTMFEKYLEQNHLEPTSDNISHQENHDFVYHDQNDTHPITKQELLDTLTFYLNSIETYKQQYPYLK